MARKSARTPLNVFLNGRLAGRLQRETSGAIELRDSIAESALNRSKIIAAVA